jgi:membrane fusion protein (multidrug efflux system)
MTTVVKRLLTIGIVLLVLGAIAWPKLDLIGSDDTSTTQAAGGGPLAVNGYVVRESRVADRILTTGTVMANEEVQLASEVSGMITEILFEEGTYVEAGQLLIKINDADLQAQYDRAVHRLRLAEQQVSRQEALLEQGGVSQEEFDLTQNELRLLEADLRLIDAQLEKTEVRAPFAGRIGLRQLSAGSFITPQSRIASLQDLSSVKIDFSLPEKYAGQLRVGSRVEFSVPSQAGSFRGTVYALEPRVDENTRTLQIRARSPNPDGRLLPGAFADVELILAEYEDALVVPTISVVPEVGGSKVYRLQNGTVEERRVDTGIRTQTTVQVLSGLAVGDTVLTTGLQLVRTGMPVQVTVEAGGVGQAEVGA